MDPGNLRCKCQGFYLIAPTCYLQLHLLHQLLNSKPYHSTAAADDNLFIPFFLFLFPISFIHPSRWLLSSDGISAAVVKANSKHLNLHVKRQSSEKEREKKMLNCAKILFLDSTQGLLIFFIQLWLNPTTCTLSEISETNHTQVKGVNLGENLPIERDTYTHTIRRGNG